MCGIVGVLAAAHEPLTPLDQATLRNMREAVAHRGPDDGGEWSDRRIALGHRRLAIIDPSTAGRQPMMSPSGRLAIVFNGEIYNYRDVRSDLTRAGHVVPGETDTMVLLCAIEQWGLDGALARVRGQFAFAVWDQVEGSLHLVRDRFGEKPLAYGRLGDQWAFASELVAFERHPGFRPLIDREALTLYARFGYVPAPWTVWEGIRKLPPGHVVTLRPGDASARPRRYWSPVDAFGRGRTGAPSESDKDVEAVIARAVQEATVADVPVGAFLSGGIDSSLVVALMAKAAPGRVQTFTIGFTDPRFDESPYAAQVASHLGTTHRELVVDATSVLTCIQDIATRFDEPFADASQVPTFLVAQLARQHVKVCLSGDGGDELFGGYNRYTRAARVWRRVRRIPRPLRKGVAALVRALPRGWLDRLQGGTPPAGLRSEKARKLAALLEARDDIDAYRRLVSLWYDPACVVVGAREPAGEWSLGVEGLLEERMMQEDLLGYLPGDILVKTDRASMAVGLEGRAPLLDPGVLATAAALPLRSKIRHGQGKRVLRSILRRHLPAELVDRPKMGFALPLADWLRGPLRPWAEGLLDRARLDGEGFFVADVVRDAWTDHVEGRRNRQDELWPILMFQAWWKPRKTVPARPQEVLA